MKDYKVQGLRTKFPALHHILDNARTPIYLDGAGGSQVPQSVIDAMSTTMQLGLSNLGGYFNASCVVGGIVDDARQHAADLLNAPNKDCIVFGANMTTITQYMSWMIAAEWQAGDEIILSDLDHGANRSFWEIQAELKGVTVRYIPVTPDACELDMAVFERLISEKTVFVAVTAASNLTGSIVDVEAIVSGAKAVGATSYIDAVHLVPHKRVDVIKLQADYVVCSAYKFFGPHVGILYGREEALASLVPNKVTPAPSAPPRCFETGTPNIPCLAGVTASIQHIASLTGEDSIFSDDLAGGYLAIQTHESALLQHFKHNIASIKGLRLLGHSSDSGNRHTPTFALSFYKHHASDIAKYLGEHDIYSWNGHLYADRLTRALDLDQQGGALRLSLMHYNTLEEIDKVCCLLESKLLNK
ncbi:cysteine desulfurase-like protein [Agaribacter marinus]|uniref:Cysteine desulfurase-like protein n=1 Tax=Agaribacter marinus TaxID=1431249 RepID=A0AA37WGZ9_9ALTE|nr:cysteine desulfurase-like protein [Agaribacter marinus]GLR69303.1 cysteine desulfurase-like protein [Agaribacter marinus]